MYIYIPTDTYLLPAHKGDVQINPLDMLKHMYVHLCTCFH